MENAGIEAFAIQNLYYNREQDYYVCPMGHHLEYTGQRTGKSDLGYVFVLRRYQARNYAGCPLKSPCHKSKTNRIIEVNHKLNRYK